jgi:UDP-N-acetylmuramoylalanine--D-glutamate ligase
MHGVRNRGWRLDQSSCTSLDGIACPETVTAHRPAVVNGDSTRRKRNGPSDPVPDFAGQRIVVLGLARQGIALARYLCSQGALVTISDVAPEHELRTAMAALDDLPVSFALGGHPASLLHDCDLLFLSGGVPPQIPLVREALQRGIPLSNDSLLTMQLARSKDLGPIIGITGSSGKTTTTTLVGLMLTDNERNAHVGGNIGVPLVDRMEQIRPSDPIVLELSSFQLELFDPSMTGTSLDKAGPHVAAITNITPNHLDRHSSMAAYVAAKLNLIHAMPLGSRLVVNLDDTVTAFFSSQYSESVDSGLWRKWGLEDVLVKAQGQIHDRGIDIIPYSLRQHLEQGACLVDDKLMLDGEVICSRRDIQLRGEHNISNMLAAASVSCNAGGNLRSIRHVATSFPGVPHRLEIVEQHAGITWINDSIATAPERTVAALRSFDTPAQTIILLAGGKDKNLPWDRFAAEAVTRVSFLIGFGDCGAKIVNHVKEQARFSRQQAPNCATVQRLDEAVVLASRIAPQNSVVLLSPGGTSFDAYNDYEERGEHFRRLVHQVVTERPPVTHSDQRDAGNTGSKQ